MRTQGAGGDPRGPRALQGPQDPAYEDKQNSVMTQERPRNLKLHNKTMNTGSSVFQNTTVEHETPVETLGHWRNNGKLMEQVEYHRIAENTSRTMEQHNNIKNNYQYRTSSY